MAEWSQIADDMEAYADQQTKSENSTTTNVADKTDTISKITDFKNEIAASYPAIASFVDNHLTKLPDKYGTFGLKSGLEALTKQADTITNNKIVGTYLAEVYRAKADGKGMSTVSNPPTIPGDPDPNNADPTIILPNRTAFPAVRTGDNQFKIGSIICVQGQVCVYTGGTSNEDVNGWTILQQYNDCIYRLCYMADILYDIYGPGGTAGY